MSHDFGHPSPFRFLEEGEVLEYENELGILETYVVPATLRIDDIGRRAAQKHMRESALGTTSRPLRWEGRTS